MLCTLRATAEVPRTRRMLWLPLPVTKRPTLCPCTQTAPPSKGGLRRDPGAVPLGGPKPFLPPVGPAANMCVG